MSKFYLELTANLQWIIDSESPDEAIALFWSEQLSRLRGFSERQLAMVRWSLLDVELEYFVHSGRQDLGQLHSSAGAIKFLTSDEMGLVIRALHDQYTVEAILEFSELFYKTERENNG